MLNKFEDFVNVSVRIKPSLNEETCFQVINKDPPILLILDRPQTYHFDHIFTDDATQRDVYDETVKPLVENVKAGYNCTVFAYGQTGTGKTYTMGTNPDVHNEDDCGLISRTLEDLFGSTDNEEEEIKVFISFIEIYNEKVFDLLTDNKRPLPVKGFSVQGFEKVKVVNKSHALLLLKSGGKNRHTGGTKQNSNSSRSHAVLTIYCHTRDTENERVAKLNLVDLAGSESVRKTGNQGSSFHEGININKGLLSLGQVMTALSTNSSHVPYRQSIITTILHDSLNKKNFVSLIACVSSDPDDLGITLQTLEFSQRVKKMRNKPEVNHFIAQYKRDKPGLFSHCISKSSTPLKRLNSNMFETPFKKTMPMIQEPISNNSNVESPKYLLSASMTTPNYTQNFSPVIKKYMNAMENSIMTKLENVIANTLKRPTRKRSACVDISNSSSPSVSWENVAVLQSDEILEFSREFSRATSSPLANTVFEDNFSSSEERPAEKTRKMLTYNENEIIDANDDVLFKMPLPIKRKKAKAAPSSIRRSSIRLQQKNDNAQVATENPTNRFQTYNDNDNEITDANDDVSFKMPLPVKRKKAKTTPSSIKRNSIRLQQKNDDTQVPTENPTNRRRSVRLQIRAEALNQTLREDNNNRKQGSQRRLAKAETPCVNCLKKSRLESVDGQDSPITKRTKQVLNILNDGSRREIETLHTIGIKTAEKIMLFRELKGPFKSVSDLCDLWSKNKQEKFVAENFLKR